MVKCGQNAFQIFVFGIFGKFDAKTPLSIYPSFVGLLPKKTSGYCAIGKAYAKLYALSKYNFSFLYARMGKHPNNMTAKEMQDWMKPTETWRLHARRYITFSTEILTHMLPHMGQAKLVLVLDSSNVFAPTILVHQLEDRDKRQIIEIWIISGSTAWDTLHK